MKLDREKVVPHLKQGKKTLLYLTKGRVYTVPEFIKKHLELLNNYEQIYIKRQINAFPKNIPAPLKNSLTIIKPEKNITKAIEVKSVGSRSAFWPEKKLKFKGCKPMPNLYFPHEKLNFGEKKMVVKKIIFGALSAENVMREILAFCFFKTNSLPVFQKPAWIFEYHYKSKPIGYCLIFHSPTEERLESKEDFFSLTIKDLVLISLFQNKFGVKFIKNQAGFKGVRENWYNEQKAKLMIKMNFNGGFRGILNSNLGNDIVYNKRFYICDFDTFKVIRIPKKASNEFIKNFCLWSIAEILKTSPLVLDYVDVESLVKKEAIIKLWEIYAKKSTFWQMYYKKFLNQARDLSWNLDVINKAINEAVNTKVVGELILDNVLNSKVIRETYKPELSFYTPHNY